jgi:hypothetical protein
MPAQMQPPQGIPTPFEDPDDEAWSEILETQASAARKTAENWRAGLAGLFGLIAVLSVVQGPSGIQGLHSWAAITAGILVLFSLAAAVLGAWTSLQAAYGTPRPLSRQDFRERGGIVGYRLLQATEATSKLRIAKAATLASLALAAMAVGLVWYGPRTAQASVDVTRNSAPPVCGKVLPNSARGNVDLKTGAGAVRVPLQDVQELRIVDGCE